MARVRKARFEARRRQGRASAPSDAGQIQDAAESATAASGATAFTSPSAATSPNPAVSASAAWNAAAAAPSAASAAWNAAAAPSAANPAWSAAAATKGPTAATSATAAASGSVSAFGRAAAAWRSPYQPGDPATELFLRLGRSLIPVLSSERSLEESLSANGVPVTGLVTACAAVGGAVAAPALFERLQHPIWRIAAAAGLVSPPQWVPVAGGVVGMALAGGLVKKQIDDINCDLRHSLARVTHHVCVIMAGSAPTQALEQHVTVILDSFQLEPDVVNRIRQTAPGRVDEIDVQGLTPELRRHVLEWAATLGDKGYWAGDLSRAYHAVGDRLGFTHLQVRQLLDERSRRTPRSVSHVLEHHRSRTQPLSAPDAQLIAELLERLQPQHHRLSLAVRAGELVATLITMALAATGNNDVGQVVGQVWSACRTAAGSALGPGADKGYSVIADFIRREFLDKESG